MVSPTAYFRKLQMSDSIRLWKIDVSISDQSFLNHLFNTLSWAMTEFSVSTYFVLVIGSILVFWGAGVEYLN